MIPTREQRLPPPLSTPCLFNIFKGYRSRMTADVCWWPYRGAGVCRGEVRCNNLQEQMEEPVSPDALRDVTRRAPRRSSAISILPAHASRPDR